MCSSPGDKCELLSVHDKRMFSQKNCHRQKYALQDHQSFCNILPSTDPNTNFYRIIRHTDTAAQYTQFLHKIHSRNKTFFIFNSHFFCHSTKWAFLRVPFFSLLRLLLLLLPFTFLFHLFEVFFAVSYSKIQHPNTIIPGSGYVQLNKNMFYFRFSSSFCLFCLLFNLDDNSGMWNSFTFCSHSSIFHFICPFTRKKMLKNENAQANTHKHTKYQKFSTK